MKMITCAATDPAPAERLLFLSGGRTGRKTLAGRRWNGGAADRRRAAIRPGMGSWAEAGTGVHPRRHSHQTGFDRRVESLWRA
jgi:hypothetical protein